MIAKIPELQPYVERYAALPMEPLTVTVTLRQAAIQYDPIYLDNLLARCVLESAIKTTEIERDNYELPVPLKSLWWSDDGFPLWAASVFLPVGTVATDQVYLHKRLGRFEFSKKQPYSNVGRWMDRRIPKPALQSSTGRWQAFCIGNADAIAQLLPLVRFLGKHRGAGYGEVAEWTIESWNGTAIQTIVREGRLIHAIPRMAARELGLHIKETPALVGWTPPQWKPELFALGWRIGTLDSE